MKKLLSVLLAFLMAFGYLPTTVFADKPIIEGYLSEFSFAPGNASGATRYVLEEDPSETEKDYILWVPDNKSAMFAWAKLSSSAPENSAVAAKWDGGEKSEAITSGKNSGTKLTKVIAEGSSNSIITLEAGVEGDMEIYTVTVKRMPSLKKISIFDNENNTLEIKEIFDPNVTEYNSATTSEQVTVVPEFYGESADYTVTYGDYSENNVALNVGSNIIPVKVILNGKEKIYNLNIELAGNFTAEFEVTPSDALVFVNVNDENASDNHQRLFPNEEGKYVLSGAKSYTYTVSKPGYNTKSEVFKPGDNRVFEINLEKSPKQSFIKYESAWPFFGYNAQNNMAIDWATPIAKDETALYWAKKLGSGYDSGATGVPILVDDYIYVYAGRNILKVDKVTGEVLISKKMSGGTSSFAICSLTYGEGLIFVGLANGIVQAFNAETLDSVWIYHDPLKGQPNGQLTYNDGHIYTGFWTSETGDASYVCISVTDEDLNSDNEEKKASWRHIQKGGFYWAGAYVEGDYLYIGTDDGAPGYQTGYAHLLSINKHTGETVCDVTMPHVGDIRSSVMQDGGKLYFTSKGGYFYEAEYNSSTGEVTALRALTLENGIGGVAMSTSTPTVHNGRAYVGVSGEGQFVAYSGHNITVIDIPSWSIAYRINTQGYPQTTGTLTTHYEDVNGYTYVYFFDNYTPGKLRVIADKPGMTAPKEDMLIKEKSGGKTYEVAYSVFEPTGELAQYCICTPIIDKDGTLYFKNDSAYLMAVGSAVEYIEVTEKPNKTEYEEGEIFDPTGMVVTGYYYNGTERDITKYVTYKTDPLTEDDAQFEISFEHVGGEIKPYTILELDFRGPYLKLHPKDESKEATKIRLTDTVKLDNSVDTEDVFFVDKPAGGTFYVGLISDMEYDSVDIETTGYLKGQMIDFDPEKYYSVGETYTVYDSKGNAVNNGKSISYKRAQAMAKELNNENKTTQYKVVCDQYVYVAKITVEKNYGVSYKSGTYRILAALDGADYASALHTVVTDVSIVEYENLKWAGNYGELEIESENVRGYSDFLTYKYGYGNENGKYGPIAKEKPVVLSTTGFRAIVGNDLKLLCGEGVTVEIPEIVSMQHGVNFSCKDGVYHGDDPKKKSSYSLTFYGKQSIASDFTINWNLNATAFELLEFFKIKVEEEDIVTFYITKDGKYFDEFTVDFMTDDYSKNIVLELENKAGDTLGEYKITEKAPKNKDKAISDKESEINPNTGAEVQPFGNLKTAPLFLA